MKYLMLAPAVILFALFTAWPLGEVLWLSLHKTNFITSRFIGLDNYIASFSDHYFISSVLNSLVYIAILVPGMLLVSLFFALLINSMPRKWQDASRIFLYLPTLSAGIIIAALWKWIFHYDGLANWVIGLAGLPRMNWFGEQGSAISIVAFIVIYASFGGNVIFLLSAIQAVSKDHIEAAKIDGAGWLRIQTSIIIPIIKPSLVMVGILTALAAMMIYETILMLAAYEYSATITYNIYMQGFQFGKYGLASAQAILLMALSLVLYAVKRRFE